MIKSPSLPETELTTQEEYITENVHKKNNNINEKYQENHPEKQKVKGNRGAKRWRLLRMITLMTKKNKEGKRKRFATTSDITESTCDSFSEESIVSLSNGFHKIKVTKPHGNFKECCENECIEDDDTYSNESEHNSITNKALATAVSKWKETIRPATAPVEYEFGKLVPRRSGVCEEIEKTVQSDGTTLHELRKDLTVYLTLDELGML